MGDHGFKIIDFDFRTISSGTTDSNLSSNRIGTELFINGFDFGSDFETTDFNFL